MTPDGILDSAPEGLPLDPPDPPTPALPSVAPPLADPVSLTPLDARTGYARANGLRYAETDGVWDLTLGAAVNAPGGSGDATSLADLARSLLPLELRGLIPTSGYLGTATFETPQVAFAYERGWRDSFARAGFPGPDEEFELARAKLLPHAANGVLLDASCGSGLFSRRFAKSGEYGAVIALDFSDAMLRQARRFARDEDLLGGGGDGAEDSGPGPTTTSPLTFVRADIARLPFPSGTIAGVHAGAAIHCWPDPRSALAEVARVMTPGASFCGTTFLTPRVPFADDQAQRAIDAAMREVQDAVAGRAGGARGFRMWNKLDLKELCVDSGLVDFECDERGGFIFFAAKKPPAYEEPEDEAYRPTEI